MQTIIVATDFSSASFGATEYASDMAVAIDAGLLLLHIIAYPISYTEIPLMVDMDGLIEDAQERLQMLKKKLLARSGDGLNIQMEAKMGQFFPELQLTCENIKPYTVVIGSQGNSAAERFLFGSHAVYAMKHLIWPLITVPPNATFSSIKKIGLACDFNNVSQTIPIAEIKALVNDFKAELHVINIGKKEAFNPEIIFQSSMLEQFIGGLKPVYHYIDDKNTDESLIAFTEKNHIGLLIVLPKRHGLIDSLIHESHTRQLVLHSHVPVMALHFQQALG